MTSKPTRITAGALQNLHLSEIAQMLSLGGKTACVTVASDGREGRVWFRDGAVVHARVGIWYGEEVFYQLLGWRSGYFVIEHGAATDWRTVDKDTMYLVMEGLRRGDEASRSEVTDGPDRAATALAVPAADAAPHERERRVALFIEVGLAILILGALATGLVIRGSTRGDHTRGALRQNTAPALDAPGVLADDGRAGPSIDAGSAP